MESANEKTVPCVRRAHFPVHRRNDLQAAASHKERDIEGEAKEAFASASAESRRANRAKRAVHAPRRRRNVEEIAKMLDIEDVYLGEDSSIQCVVR